MLLYSLVATLSIVSVFLLLVVMRRPAGQVMPIAYLITVVIALVAWRSPIVEVAAASVQGLFATAEILYIVFGATLLLNTLKLSGAIIKASAWFELTFVQPDDYRLLKSSQLQHSALTTNRFVPADKTIIHWHRLYHQRLTEQCSPDSQPSASNSVVPTSWRMSQELEFSNEFLWSS